MGNCMEAFRNSPETEKNMSNEEEVVKSEVEKGNNKVRIKIVLTKEELEWLMIELQKTQGKKFEELMEEIQRSRERNVGWKPSLDSIVEIPEVPEGMDR